MPARGSLLMPARGLPLVPARGLLVLALAAMFLVLQPAPGHAHTRTEETLNIDSRIVHEPAVDGLSWTVHTGGLLLEVDNRSGHTVEIEGYDGEPYLRIDDDGVARNRRSPATYLNADTGGDVVVPPVADATAPPEWERVSPDPTWRWHDHRTHWMSPEPPAWVRTHAVSRMLMRAGYVGPIGDAGGREGPFSAWAVPFSVDGDHAVLEGELRWEAPPPAWPWWLAAGVLVLPGALGVRAVTRQQRDRLVRPAAAMLVGVAALNFLHLVDDVAAWPQPVLDDLFGVLHTGLFLGAGLLGAAWAWAGSRGQVLMLGMGSAAVLYHQGLLHLPMLAASQFPTVWPDGLVRLSVALGVAQVVPVVIVVLAARRADAATAPGGPGAGPSSGREQRLLEPAASRST